MEINDSRHGVDMSAAHAKPSGSASGTKINDKLVWTNLVKAGIVGETLSAKGRPASVFVTSAASVFLAEMGFITMVVAAGVQYPSNKLR